MLSAAAFLYDKRGTGQSEGNWRDATFEELAMDALAALRRVSKLPRVDPERVGFQGHSEAGFVIPIAAAGHPEVAFSIVVSGGPIPPTEQTRFDKSNDLRRAGFDDTEREKALQILDRVHAYIAHKEGDRKELEVDFVAAQAEPWFDLLDLPRLQEVPSWENPPEVLIREQQDLLYDGGEFVQRMAGRPLLVLLGAEDATVPPEATATAWRRHLGNEGSERARIEIVPGANHGFRDPAADRNSLRVPAYDSIQREWWESTILNPPKDNAPKGDEP